MQETWGPSRGSAPLGSARFPPWWIDMRQINIKLVLILTLVAVLGGAGIFALNRLMVSRNAGSLLTRAEAAVEKGERNEALQLLSRYVEMRPDDAEAYSLYSELLLEAAQSPGAGRSDFSRAYSSLETAVRKDPNNLFLRQQLARFQIFINRPGDAREHLLVLRDRIGKASAETPEADGDPESPQVETEPRETGKKLLSPGEIDVLLARALAGTARFDEAADVLAERIGYDRSAKTFSVPVNEAEKGNTDAYILLALILDDEIRSTSEAEAILSRLVEVNADDARAWLAMKGWHAQRGDAQAAAEDVLKAIEVAPDDLEALLASFELSLERRQMDEAGRAVARAAELYPAEERVVRAAAMLALRQGDRPEAIEVLKQGLERMPGQVSLLMMLADTYLQIGEIEQTDETVKQLTAVSGDSNPAVGLLQARLSMARMRWREAQQQLETIRPMANPSSDIVRQIDLYLGQCYEKLGQIDRQLEANQRVLSDDPNSIAARVGAAAALSSSGRKEQARAEYEVIFNAMAPDDVSAFPQIWNPLLQLRIDEQLALPSEDRDWTRTDELVELLGGSPRINDAQIAILRADVLVRKEQPDAAIALLREGLSRDPSSEPLLGALVTLLRQFEGPAAALSVIEAAPEEVRNTPTLMTLEASVVASGPREEAAARLTELEKRTIGLQLAGKNTVVNAIANAYAAIEQDTDAARVYRELLAEAPDNLAGWEALFRLAEQTNNVELIKEASRSIARLSGPASAEAKVAEAATLMLETRLAAAARAEGGVEAAFDDSARQALTRIRGLLIEAETERQNWHEIQLRFADIALAERDLDTAIDRLKQAARLAPGNTLILRRMISLLHSANRLDEAKEAMALLRPQEMQGLERVTADIEFRSGNFDAAVAIAERAIPEDSQSVEDLAWFGRILSSAGETERAIQFFRRVVEQDPSRPADWLSLISLLIESGQKDSAELTVEEATAALSSPDREMIGAQGAELLGRYEEAEDALRQALESADSDAIQLGQTLASFLIRRGRLDDAEKQLADVISAPLQKSRDRPVKAWARRTLAELLADRGSYRELQQAVALIDANAEDERGLSPDDMSLIVRLLAARLEPASWRQALERLEDLEDLQPPSIQQRLLEAQLLEKLGRWDEARNAYISLLGTTNPPPLVYAALIEKLIIHEELTTASMWLQKLEQQARDAPITHALTAKLAVAEDDREKAVEAAKELMPTETVPDERLNELRSTAMLMEDLGFPKAAAQLWETFASRSVDGALGRAEFLGRQGETSAALDLLENVWEQIPLERLLQSGVVIARNEAAPPSEATATRLKDWFQKAKRIDPGSLTIPLLEAEFLDLEGQPEAVEAVYRELLERADLLGTQRAIVANNLAFHLAKPDTIDEASRLIETAIDELGPHPDLLDTRGLIRLAQGQVEKSVQDLQEAVLAPTAAKFLHLAEAQLSARQVSAARRSLEQAKKLGLKPERLSSSDQQRLEQVEAGLSSSTGA